MLLREDGYPGVAAVIPMTPEWMGLLLFWIKKKKRHLSEVFD